MQLQACELCEGHQNVMGHAASRGNNIGAMHIEQYSVTKSIMKYHSTGSNADWEGHTWRFVFLRRGSSHSSKYCHSLPRLARLPPSAVPGPEEPSDGGDGPPPTPPCGTDAPGMKGHWGTSVGDGVASPSASGPLASTGMLIVGGRKDDLKADERTADGSGMGIPLRPLPALAALAAAHARR